MGSSTSTFQLFASVPKKKKRKRGREKSDDAVLRSDMKRERERDRERVKPLNIRYVSFIPVNFFVKKFLTYSRIKIGFNSRNKFPITLTPSAISSFLKIF